MKDWRGNYEHLSVHHLMGHQRTGCWMKPRARQNQNHPPCPRAPARPNVRLSDTPRTGRAAEDVGPCHPSCPDAARRAKVPRRPRRGTFERARRGTSQGGRVAIHCDYLNIGQTDWDPTEPVATRPLVWLGEDGLACFFHDGNKNVVDFVPTGIAPSACHYAYTPFGMDTGSAGDTDINPWRFSSESIDELLKLTYYNYRHYDLRIGRWINRDPIELLDDESLIEEDSSTKSSYRRNEAEVRISLCYVFVSDMPSMRFDMQGLIDVLCTCISAAPSDGSEVGPKLNGNVCGAATLGTSFSSTHSWPCMAQPFFNDMDLIECFCKDRTCTQEIQYSCAERITKRQIHVYNWTVSGSKTSGCQ